MTITTAAAKPTAMDAATKVAVVAEVLDLCVDHETDLNALVADVESDGYTITTDPTAELTDELLTRVPAYSTAPIPY